jgi:hypothetical protein
MTAASDEGLLKTIKSHMGDIIEFQNAGESLRNNARVASGYFLSRHSQLTWGFRLE